MAKGKSKKKSKSQQKGNIPPLPKGTNRMSNLKNIKEFANEKGIYNLAILGHSQVKNLSKLDKRCIVVRRKLIRIRYFHSMGSNYQAIRLGPALQHIFQFQPHFIVVWVAGNEVGSSKTREEIKNEMIDFYQTLRDEFPNTCLIATQVENRFYEPENDYGAPHGKEWELKRNCINVYMNRSLRTKDYLIPLGDKDGLDDEKFYNPRDLVHLNKRGLEKFFEKLEVCMESIIGELENLLQTEKQNGVSGKVDEPTRRELQTGQPKMQQAVQRKVTFSGNPSTSKPKQRKKKVKA